LSERSEGNGELLGRAIAVARAEQNLKRKELADFSGVSYAYVSEIEKGSKYPSQRVLVDLASALGLTPFELLTKAEALSIAERTGVSVSSSSLSSPIVGSSVSAPSGRSAEPSGHDELVDRVTSEVMRAVEPRLREQLEREVRIAVREELLRLRDLS
jgi:transcriptional regulator with XRE-family HTH domain